VTPSAALSPYCHQQGTIGQAPPVEKLFINTYPEDGGDVDHVCSGRHRLALGYLTQGECGATQVQSGVNMV